jgi:hypothetical protein
LRIGELDPAIEAVVRQFTNIVSQAPVDATRPISPAADTRQITQSEPPSQRAES